MLIYVSVCVCFDCSDTVADDFSLSAGVVGSAAKENTGAVSGADQLSGNLSKCFQFYCRQSGPHMWPKLCETASTKSYHYASVANASSEGGSQKGRMHRIPFNQYSHCHFL